MPLADDLTRIAEAARAFAAWDERVEAVLAAEPADATRIYLCAFGGEQGRGWLALDDAGEPVLDRARVRAAVSIAALCEIAADTAGGGDLDDLRQRLVALRLTENPPGSTRPTKRRSRSSTSSARRPASPRLRSSTRSARPRDASSWLSARAPRRSAARWPPRSTRWKP